MSMSGGPSLSMFSDSRHGVVNQAFSAADLADAIEMIDEETRRSNNLGGNQFGAGNSSYNDPSTLPDIQSLPSVRRRSISPLSPSENIIGTLHRMQQHQPDLMQPWAQVKYNELDSPVGEEYKARVDSFSVDGFTSNNQSDRFCLGAVASGKQSKNGTVVSVKRQIGQGIRVNKLPTSIELFCLSGSAVFVQSPLHAHMCGDNLSTVYRISPRNSLELFDWDIFEELMHNKAKEGYTQLYNLQNMCHARVSFVKGFGAEYRRQTINMTPCWVEIHFLEPLQRLDQVLQTTDGPPNKEMDSFD